MLIVLPMRTLYTENRTACSKLGKNFRQRVFNW